MCPDRMRPFTIEQEGERRDDGKRPCPEPRASAREDNVHVAAIIAAPVRTKAVWKQGSM